MKNGFLTYFVAKNRRNDLNWRIPSAMVAAIALLFAFQGFSRADDDHNSWGDDDHEAAPITTCGVISQSGRYFVANDLTHCNSGLSITVSKVKLELRGHTIQADAIAAPLIIVKEEGGASLFNIEIEGPGTVTGGTAGIEFDNVHGSWVHNVVAAGNEDGIDIGASGCTTINPTISATASTDNVFSDNVAAANFFCGISVNGGNHNSFIHNNLTGNFSDGLLFFNAKNNTARRNTVDANGFNGIDIGVLGSENIIDHNTAFGNATNHSNGAVDMMDQNNNCTQNTWTNNSFNLSSPVCIR